MQVVSRRPDVRQVREPIRWNPLGIAGWLTTGLFLFPLAYLLWESVSDGEAVARLISGTVAGPLIRSIALAVATALLASVLGVGVAVLVTRTDLPGRRFWGVAAALPLVIPSYVAAAALRAAFGSGGLVPGIPRPSGFGGSLLVLAAVTYPYVLLPVAARLRSMPASLEEAGRLLGSSGAMVFRRVVLPQARTAIISGALIAFLYALSDFGAVSLMRYDTVTRAIFASRLADRPTALALGLVLGVIALAVAAATRSSRDNSGANVASSVRIYSLGRARFAAMAGMAGVIGLALVAPVAVFVVWWLRSTGSSTWVPSVQTLWDPALHSALAGIAAGGLAMVLLLPAAYLVARRSSLLASAASASIASTFALPGLVLALTLVYWVLQAPGPIDRLYQSFPLLILAYVVHFGVQAHRSSSGAVQALPERYGEAAQVLGAGAVRRFLSIDLPLIMPGVIAGGGLVMLSTLKELPATLLLAPTGFDTLATRVWGAAADGFLAEVGITSLVLILMSGVLTWFLVLRPSGLADPGADESQDGSVYHR